MRILFALPLLLLLSPFAATAQAVPRTEDQLNTLWQQKKYDELATLIEAKVSANPPDVVACYCAKFFYVLVQPNKAKALAAGSALKSLADATGDSMSIQFVNHEIAQVQGIPDAAFKAPEPEFLAALHELFGAAKYPNIYIAVRLRQELSR